MKIGIIGIGHMGRALVNGFSNIQGNEIIALNHPNSQVAKLSQKLHFSYFTKAECFIEEKPQVIFVTTPAQITISLLKSFPETDATIISATAGISLEELSNAVPHNKIVRIIPNIPVAINAGTISISFSNTLSSSEKDDITKLLKQLGDVIKVDEDKLSIAGTIGGCGPAFIDIFLDAIADSGVLNGLDKKTAIHLAASMTKGSAQLALESSKAPIDLKDEICSPGGTTIKGVIELEKNNFRNSVIAAVSEANKN